MGAAVTGRVEADPAVMLAAAAHADAMSVELEAVLAPAEGSFPSWQGALGAGLGPIGAPFAASHAAATSNHLVTARTQVESLRAWARKAREGAALYEGTDGGSGENIASDGMREVDHKEKFPAKESPDASGGVAQEPGVMPTSPAYPGVNTAQFEHVYGRAPVSESDWKMAQLMDTNTLVGRNNGVPAQVVVGHIKPVPGQGIVRMALYIPANNVFNLPRNDLGDDRGPQQQFDPRQTRVSLYIDYENGVVVARQNPSVAGMDQVQVATPSVDVQETSDGRLRISYDAANPFSPSIASSAGWSVHGDITLMPNANGVQVDGTVGKYPSMEIYQDRQGSTATVYQYQATGSEYGPMADLPKPYNIGTGDHGPINETKPGYQTWDYASPGAQTHVTEIVVPGQQMKLGPVEAPPSVAPVEPSPPPAQNPGAI